MNTTNILLVTTSLLILVAFVLSFGNFKTGTSGDEAREQYEKLRLELAELKAETRTINEMRRAALFQNPANPPSPRSSNPTSEVSDLTQKQQEEISNLQELLAEQEAAAAEERRKAELFEQEAAHFNAEKTREEQREERKKNRVRIALKMGTVDVVNTEYGFLSFTPNNQMNFQPGDTLGIRRHSGVLGRVRVSRQEGTQYVADIQPNAYSTTGLPEVRAGDELIKLPDDYKKPESE